MQQLLQQPQQPLLISEEYALLNRLRLKSEDYRLAVMLFLQNTEVLDANTYLTAKDLHAQGTGRELYSG